VLLAADGVSNNESIGQNRIAMTARWVAKIALRQRIDR